MKNFVLGNFHTLLGSIAFPQKPILGSVSVRIPLLDQEFTTLIINAPLTKPSREKVVVLFHGLGGCAQSHYLVRLVPKLLELGYTVVRFNHLGAWPEDCALVKSLYHCGRYLDLWCALQYVAQRWPGAEKFAVGYSLSANMLLYLLGRASGFEKKVLEQYTRYFAVCPPVDLLKSIQHLGSPKSFLYDRYFARILVKKFLDWNSNGKLNVSHKEVSQIKSVYEFDDLITSQFCRASGALEYYHRYSSGRVVSNIVFDTTLIAALDDPIVDSTGLLSCEFPKNVELRLLDHGGHVGFVDLNSVKTLGKNHALDNQILSRF